ncbi:hypothetical protein F4782DRAFT_533772 [Xylaria castorea]|nr:hypothetical protein F4782DRAFT_533772 [Xylaria castorea]
MASSWTPEDDNWPYTRRRTRLNPFPTNYNATVSRPDLQALPQQANDEAAHWKQNANRMRHERDQAKGDIRALRRDLKAIESRCYELSRRFRPFHDFNPQTHKVVSLNFAARAREAQNTIKSLEKEINEKANEHDSVVSLWQDAIQELDEANSSKKSLTIDDDAMASKWKQLQFIIKNLSTSYFYGLATSSINSVTSEDLERYRQLMPFSRESLAGNEYYSYLCQIKIWDFITSRILSVPTIVWGQDVFDSTERLFAIITVPGKSRVSASDFHTFRAQTGEIIKTATNVDLAICDNLKAELRAQLRPFTSPENDQEVSRQLDKIIDNAVDLAIIFSLSRCDYYIESVDRGSEPPFNADTMDNVNGDGGGGGDGGGDGMQVHSIISPAFFKYGNSKGENYGESIILVKAAVLC